MFCDTLTFSHPLRKQYKNKRKWEIEIIEINMSVFQSKKFCQYM